MTSSVRLRGYPVAVAVSLVAALQVIVGDAVGASWTDYVAALYVTPLLVSFIASGGLSTARGRCWAAGMVFSIVGDIISGSSFLALLGAFLVAHLCYVVALWPSRGTSWFGKPRSAGHLLVLLAALIVLLPRVGAELEMPVIAYGVVLVSMAVLAVAAGRRGLVGGGLFMVSDLTLGITTFAVVIPTALQTLLVIGTYVPAQILLTAGFWGLLTSDLSRNDNPAPTG